MSTFEFNWKKVVPARSALSGLVALALCFTSHAAGPQGAQVVHGQVKLDRPNSNTLDVTNSRNAIINWQSFSIGAGQTTRFNQPDSSSAVLNRVVGPSASELLGQLQSNGRVFLVNPNGVVFGKDAVVDTAAFVASTLNITDKDFLAGKFAFEGDAKAGSIVNRGLIRARKDGGVYLIAPNIENSGIVRTDAGQLLLAAGRKLTISSMDVDHISFEIQAPDNQVVNLGKLLTNGGAMGVFAGSIRNHGVLEANTTVTDQNGKIRLVAGSQVDIKETSKITASGPKGGQIHIESQTGTTKLAGTVEAKGSTGAGGETRILGKHVLVDSSQIDVTGASGGGNVLLGGDFQGKGAVPTAQVTQVGARTVIRANAMDSGNGGKVVVWADGKTQFLGQISARGGTTKGDGGLVEVSGKKLLDYRGQVDTRAPRGRTGNLLLDPTNILVGSDGGLAGLSDVDEFGDPDTSDNEIGPLFSSIDAEAINNAQSNVSLQATNDITFAAPINILARGVGLNVQANNNIDVINTAHIVTNGGDISLRADADSNGSGGVGIGSSNNGPPGRTELRANGGSVTIVGGANDQGFFGIILNNAKIDAGGGNINLTGRGTPGPFSRGFVLRGNSAIETTGSGTITIDGGSQGGTDLTHGILVEQAGGQIRSQNGNIRLVGSASGTGAGNIGIELNSTVLETTGTGSIELVGTGSAGTQANHGIVIAQGTNISSAKGSINLTGNAGSGTQSVGSSIRDATTVLADGSIEVNGTVQTEADLNLVATNGSLTLTGEVRSNGGNLDLRGGKIDTSTANVLAFARQGIGGAIHVESTGDIAAQVLYAVADSGRGGGIDLRARGDIVVDQILLGSLGSLSTPSASPLALVVNAPGAVNIGLVDMGVANFNVGTVIPPRSLVVGKIGTAGGNVNFLVSGDYTHFSKTVTNGGNITIRSGGTIEVSGKVQTDGGKLDLTGATINIGHIGSADLSVGDARGSISLNSTGGTINFKDATLLTDRLTLDGAVVGDGSLSILPISKNTLRIGAQDDPLLSSKNVANLAGFTGALSIGGRIAPPSSDTQARAGAMVVEKDLAVKGDLTLVSLDDISISPGGSLRSDRTLTLAALGQGTQGNISDPARSDRFYFDAPTVTLFANGTAGTQTNPLTLRSGPNTVKVGAGAGSAFFDGAPGALELSGPRIQDMYDSFRAIGLNLNSNILRTQATDLSGVPEKPLPPEFFPAPEPGPRRTDETEQSVNAWVHAVDHSAQFNQWFGYGPQIVSTPSTTTISTFVPQPSVVRITFTVNKPGAADILFRGGSWQQSHTFDNLPAGTYETDVFLSNAAPIFLGGGGTFQPVTFSTVRPISGGLPPSDTGTQVAPPTQPGVALPPPVPQPGEVQPAPRDDVGNKPTPVEITVSGKDKNGQPSEVELKRVSGTQGRKALPPGAHLIDPVEFGPPTTLRLKENDITKYRFLPLEKFDRAVAAINRTQGSVEVAKQSLPEGLSPNRWYENYEWKGMDSKNRPAVGSHRLLIRAWKKTGEFEAGRSDGTVTVME
jgi:filamentous hemagglutinin family protein